MADNKMVRLTHSNGGTVSVPEEKAARLLAGAGWSDGTQSAHVDGDFSTYKVADLRAEIDRRNEGRDEADLISTEGKKADLLAALEADTNK